MDQFCMVMLQVQSFCPTFSMPNYIKNGDVQFDLHNILV